MKYNTGDKLKALCDVVMERGGNVGKTAFTKDKTYEVASIKHDKYVFYNDFNNKHYITEDFADQIFGENSNDIFDHTMGVL